MTWYSRSQYVQMNNDNKVTISSYQDSNSKTYLQVRHYVVLWSFNICFAFFCPSVGIYRKRNSLMVEPILMKLYTIAEYDLKLCMNHVHPGLISRERIICAGLRYISCNLTYSSSFDSCTINDDLFSGL